MTRDPLATGTLQLAESWEQEAAQREQRAPGVPDPVAATLKTNAADLRLRVEAIERDTAYLTVAEYAAMTGTSEQTVRRLCAARLLEGAERDPKNEWRIPRGAKRRAAAS